MSYIVYYDLETSGRNSAQDSILQVGAVSGNGLMFSQYVKPQTHIFPGATVMHGLSTPDGTNLYKYNVLLDAHHVFDVMRDFASYLQTVRGAQPGGLILVAHNGRNFSDAFLVRAMTVAGQKSRFDGTVAGFDDPLRLLTASSYPASQKLDDLARMYLERGLEHDALNDAIVLKEVSRHLGLENSYQPFRAQHY